MLKCVYFAWLWFRPPKSHPLGWGSSRWWFYLLRSRAQNKKRGTTMTNMPKITGNMVRLPDLHLPRQIAASRLEKRSLCLFQTKAGSWCFIPSNDTMVGQNIIQTPKSLPPFRGALRPDWEGEEASFTSCQKHLLAALCVSLKFINSQGGKMWQVHRPSADKTPLHPFVSLPKPTCLSDETCVVGPCTYTGMQTE